MKKTAFAPNLVIATIAALSACGQPRRPTATAAGAAVGRKPAAAAPDLRCAPSSALQQQVQMLQAAGRLDSAARRLAKQAPPECPDIAAALAKEKRELYAELGRCDDLSHSGADDKLQATCQERAKDKADDLILAGRKTRTAGDAAGAQRLFDRALSALERETGAKAELLGSPAPRAIERVLTSADGAVTVGGAKGTLVRSVAGSKWRWQLQADPFDALLALRDDGKQLVGAMTTSTTSGIDSGVELWALSPMAKTAGFKLLNSDQANASYTKDGSRLLVEVPNGGIRLVDAGSGNVVVSWDDSANSSGAEGSVGASLGDDGKFLIARMMNDGVKIFDTKDGREVARVPNAWNPSMPQLTDEGKTVLVCVTIPRPGVVVDPTLPGFNPALLSQPSFFVYDLVARKERKLAGACSPMGPLLADGRGWAAVIDGAGGTHFVDVHTGKQVDELPPAPEAPPDPPPVKADNALREVFEAPVVAEIPGVWPDGTMDLETGRFSLKTGEKTAQTDSCPQLSFQGKTLSICRGGQKDCKQVALKFKPTDSGLSGSCAWALAYETHQQRHYELAVVDVASGAIAVQQKLDPPSLDMDFVAPSSAAKAAREADLCIVSSRELIDVDLATGKEKSRTEIRDPHQPDMVRAGLITKDGGEIALRDCTGKTVWKVHTSALRYQLIDDATLAAQDPQGKVTVFKLPSGQVQREIDLPPSTLMGRLAFWRADRGYFARDVLGDDPQTLVGYESPKTAWFLRGAGGFKPGETGFDARAVVVNPKSSVTPLTCRFGSIYTGFDACSGRFLTASLDREP